MPYLNWKLMPSESLSQDVSPQVGVRPEFLLTLKLDFSARDELVSRLGDVFLEGGAELRVDLPREWILFWKNREGESRLLLAHPQPEEWVSTLALVPEHGAAVIEELKRLQPSQSVTLSKLGAIGNVSNVEVMISLKKEDV